MYRFAMASRQRIVASGVLSFWLGLAGVHCAAGQPGDGEETGSDSAVGQSTSGSSSAGGGIGGAGGMAAGSGGQELPCGIDCSTIEAPACSEARCNMDTKQCEIVSTDGGSCDDGLFCTTNDTCSDGKCLGGEANTCNMTPEDCQEVICNEEQKSCSVAPLAEGAACTPVDLCQLGATCQNGLCIGATNDCFFQPVPNDCHVSVCNPANGQCEPQIGNEGQGCADANDLCTIGKTCSGGQCLGGMPKDCSNLTQGCFNGVCDTMTGACVQQPILPGQQCAEATDDCNQGICDMQGMCNAQPVNENGSCNSDSCLLNQSCQMGVCQGGTAITACANNDQCCPSGCTIANDNDCLTEITFAALNEGHDGNLGGIAGADALCNQQATTAGLMGTWKAFLSSSTQDVKDIVPAALQALPVKNLLGGVMYNNWNAMFGPAVVKWLVSQDLKSFDGKDVDEGQGAVPDWIDADGWHGSNTDGTAAPNFNCSDWTSTTTQARNGEWDFKDLLGQETHTCNYTAAIGCVRVGP
jgi:hypothetical protein